MPQLPDASSALVASSGPLVAPVTWREQVEACISRSTRLNIAAQGGSVLLRLQFTLSKSKLERRGDRETGKVEFILVVLEVCLVLCCTAEGFVGKACIS